VPDLQRLHSVGAWQLISQVRLTLLAIRDLRQLFDINDCNVFPSDLNQTLRSQGIQHLRRRLAIGSYTLGYLPFSRVNIR
jgi:hypothetical protein